MEKVIKDIEEVTSLTIKMGDLALSMFVKAIDALDRDDIELVNEMKESRVLLHKFEDTIETKVFRILMLYQPMSADMRTVATMLKITTYFERIGKYGYNIAKYSVDIKDGKTSAAFREVMDMGRLASEMVSGVMDSLKTRDISKLRMYSNTEIRLDEYRKKILAEAIDLMKNNPERVEDGNMIIFASRYLERAGDYAGKLAEKIIFMVSGEYSERY